ncbi:hypothetical protein ACFPZ0_08660 [Streptomonospora nanhaiensis]
MAEAKGGTLDVGDSDRLGGAVFTLRLPLYVGGRGGGGAGTRDGRRRGQ